MTAQKQYADFGKAVAATLCLADGELVSGRVLKLDNEIIVRLIRRYADDYGIAIGPSAPA